MVEAKISANDREQRTQTVKCQLTSQGAVRALTSAGSTCTRTHARTHTQLEGSEELTPSYTLLQACGESLSNVDLQQQNTVALWHIY